LTDDIVIKVENITKTYQLYNSNLDRLKESLHPLRRKYHYEFNALTNVSFNVKKGEAVGIIGRNGSGKSTLLKILTGVLTPTDGNVVINGKVSALLELGSGFNPELKGIENVYFNGMLMGYTREEMDEKMDDILSFSDIGEFVNQPVKNYSSGMFVRLAFAVAINVDPDILIVDEALSVGDIKFQRKCFSKIEEFREKKKTLLFVSHDTGMIGNLCNSAILLNDGKLMLYDEPRIVSKLYVQLMYGESIGEVDLYTNNAVSEAAISKEISEEDRIIRVNAINHIGMVSKASSCELRHGNGLAEIIDFGILDWNKERVNSLKSGDKYTLFFYLLFYQDMTDLFLATAIRDTQGINLFVTNNQMLKVKVANKKRGDLILVSFEIDMWLATGDYFMSCIAMDNRNSEYLDRRLDVFHFTVRTHNEKCKGFVNMMPTICLQHVNCIT